MQDCKTLNAKVQVVAWLSTFTRLVSAFQCFEVVNVCRCLYVTWDSFISERAQTDGEVNLRSLHARSWERCDLNAWLQIDVNMRPRGLKMFQRQRKMSSYATLTRQCRLTQCSKKKNQHMAFANLEMFTHYSKIPESSIWQVNNSRCCVITEVSVRESKYCTLTV